ncbi:hypothetical protein X797_010484 [Metarhizium robertsii]|uniref:Uncharacterized protein n=2 Tax=Metarhizium robertsii TaxID=568076 RepID=E9FB83_METRA|nr:uncharacterized protein MAA_09532 [Metarhizium robertsii ARSEF 23]EFY94954.1 hypothetical protein MAA_09532 [Metarhizium robertsii ARSEF 23]EXU96367.1 hypothetical protein X797_010484 [Metarhizium robertsii]
MTSQQTTAGAQGGLNQPGPAPGTAGPHRHDIINKLDPTVDSQTGGAQVLASGMNTSARGATAAQPPAAQAAAHVEGGSNKNEPRHISRMGNVLDPRVDSSKIPESGLGERQAPGASTTSSANAPEGTHGPHSTRMANTLDPRVDSDLSGNKGGVPAQGQATEAQPAPTTTGPHTTDTMNKLDPTVESQSAQPQAPHRSV